MAVTFCTTTQAIKKAGSGANATIVADTTTITDWIEECEQEMSSQVGADLVTNYSSFTAAFKEILQSICSDKVAQRIVLYDTKGYYRLTEASLLIDFLENNIVKNMARIKDDQYKTDLGAT